MQKKLLKYAIWLLSRRPHSQAEVQKKLLLKVKKDSTRKAKFSKEPQALDQSEINSAIQSVIEKLVSLKYLNDSAFAEFFIRAELTRKAQSLNLIKQKLKAKGVSQGDFSEAISKLQSEEADLATDDLILARAALERKRSVLKSSSKNTPQKIKEKLFRHLASRGFTSDTILKVLD